MAWLVLCRDVDDSANLRRRFLERHLAYVESVMDQVEVAGPLADGVDADYTASCFIYRTDDREVAESLLHNDPYFLAGLYRDVEFHAFRVAAGRWAGGAAWRESVETGRR